MEKQTNEAKVQEENDVRRSSYQETIKWREHTGMGGSKDFFSKTYPQHASVIYTPNTQNSKAQVDVQDETVR